jgi:hypothetical protein
MAVGGATLSLCATIAMERRLGALAAPYHEGSAKPFARAAKGLSAAGALTLACASAAQGRARVPAARLRSWTGGRSSRGRAIQSFGAVALLAGAALERWAIFRAGIDSAADPAATIAPQRARRNRA